jgi:hypothetical protein
MKTWLIGILGFVAGALTSPIWEYFGESIRASLFPPSSPNLHFQVASHEPGSGIVLRVINSGETPTLIHSLRAASCADGVWLWDSYKKPKRTRLSLEQVDPVVKERLMIDGEHQWLPRCEGNAVSIYPLQDKAEVKPGTTLVPFQPATGFSVKFTDRTGAAIGDNCALTLEYGDPESLRRFYRVSILSVCKFGDMARS